MHDVQAEHRRSRRLTLAMPARCRSLQGFGDDVVIRDISSHGCRIISHGISVRAGSRVVLRPVGLEGLCGEVRWVSGHQAGIEFERPLYEPVVEHLHRLYASFLPPEVPWHGTAHRLAA
jgi:hypothetical protein